MLLFYKTNGPYLWDYLDKYLIKIQLVHVNYYHKVVSFTRAYDLIESFPSTAVNYIKANERLKSRFGKDKQLVEVYMRELLKLVLQNALNGKNSRPHFKLCMINLSHIRALETLGVTSVRSHRIR